MIRSPATMAAMIAVTASALAASAVLASPAPPPVPGGKLGTLIQGNYSCETPGDATGPVGIAMADLDFRIVNGSSYKVGDERGTYLLTGDLVTMTLGPLKGVKLHRLSGGFLRKVESDGSDGEVRCVLGTRAVANAPYTTSPGADEAESRADEAGEDGASL